MSDKYILKSIKEDYEHPQDEDGSYLPISSKTFRQLNDNKEPWDLPKFQFFIQNDKGLSPINPIFRSKVAVAKWIIENEKDHPLAKQWMYNG